MPTYSQEIVSVVSVQVNDPNVIDRVVNNETSTTGYGEEVAWRDMFYDLRTEQDVIEHLAYNAAVNGYDKVNRLDGWADLPDDAATMAVVDIYPF